MRSREREREKKVCVCVCVSDGGVCVSAYVYVCELSYVKKTPSTSFFTCSPLHFLFFVLMLVRKKKVKNPVPLDFDPIYTRAAYEATGAAAGDTKSKELGDELVYHEHLVNIVFTDPNYEEALQFASRNASHLFRKSLRKAKKHGNFENVMARLTRFMLHQVYETPTALSQAQKTRLLSKIKHFWGEDGPPDLLAQLDALHHALYESQKPQKTSLLKRIKRSAQKLKKQTKQRIATTLDKGKSKNKSKSSHGRSSQKHRASRS